MSRSGYVSGVLANLSFSSFTLIPEEMRGSLSLRCVTPRLEEDVFLIGVVPCWGFTINKYYCRNTLYYTITSRID